MASHRISRRLTLALTTLFVAAALAVGAAAAQAQSGALDPTFGSGGVVLADLGGAARSDAYDVEAQPDGKVVALEVDVVSSATYVLRYLLDGTPDPSFGQQGVVKLPSTFQTYALALQADGKILVGGSVSGSFAVARLLATGELDQGFDGDSGTANGLVTTLMSAAGPGHAHAIAVDSKQRIVLAGKQDAGTKSYFAIARYQPDGKLDQSFNGGGRLVDPGSGADLIEAVTTQDDGTIVAAGRTGAYPNGDTVVSRYAETGAPDTGFGSSGRTQIDVGGDDTAVGVALQPGNRVLVAAESSKAEDRLIRLGADGKQDPSFAGGNAPLGLGITALALAPDGKIVLGGWVLDDGNDACALTRRNADGSPDAGFGNGAPVLTRAVPNSPCVVEAAAVAPDGKIVAGDHTGEYPHERAAIARYQVDADPAGGTTGGTGGTTGGGDGSTGGSDASAGGDAGPQGGGGPNSTPPSAPPTPDALILSGLKVTNRSFTVKRAVTPRVGQAQAARRAKRGTTFGFALNRAAAVPIRIDRLGKRRKARVVARLKRSAAVGANRVAFSGHVGRRLLAPGSYRATFTALDATGNRAEPQAVTFRIVRG
jgi:uncharacterized delta-60 repeat protein